MQIFKNKFGREYLPFDYIGSKNAEDVIISMGSSNDTIEESVNYLLKNIFN